MENDEARRGLEQWEIYETTNLTNGSTYIGQHRHTATCKGPRLDRACRYLGSGVAILKAIHKYGRSSFSKRTLSVAYDQSEADRVEREQILKAKQEGRGQYNIYVGHRVETPAINRNNSYRDTPYRHSPEQRQKLSAAASAKWQSQEGRAVMMKNHNTVVSEALKSAARDATLKIWADEETARERRLAVKRGNLKANHLLGKHEHNSRNKEAQENRELYCPLCS